ncbi:MAG: NfeD family protein [Armatimonadetes bacterium]|nr:NfeD family protein [Armatimonadota bacterium]
MWCHLLLAMPLLGLVFFGVLPLPVAAAVYGVTVLASLGVYAAVYRAMRLPVKGGPEELIGRRGIAVEEINPYGQIRVGREVWRATARTPIPAGTAVRITELAGVTATVERDETFIKPQACERGHSGF